MQITDVPAAPCSVHCLRGQSRACHGLPRARGGTSGVVTMHACPGRGGCAPYRVRARCSGSTSSHVSVARAWMHARTMVAAVARALPVGWLRAVRWAQWHSHLCYVCCVGAILLAPLAMPRWAIGCTCRVCAGCGQLRRRGSGGWLGQHHPHRPPALATAGKRARGRHRWHLPARRRRRLLRVRVAQWR